MQSTNFNDSSIKRTLLTADNYQSGLLMDEELMAGVSKVQPNQQQAGEGMTGYTAFVVRHTTGETLGSAVFENLFEAIRHVNSIERNWEFTKMGGCGGCADGSCGKKNGGGCNKLKSSKSDVTDQGAVNQSTPDYKTANQSEGCGC